MQMKTNLEQEYKVDYRDNCSFKVTPWYTQMIRILVMSFVTYNLHIKLFYTASSYLFIIVSIASVYVRGMPSSHLWLLSSSTKL